MKRLSMLLVLLLSIALPGMAVSQEAAGLGKEVDPRTANEKGAGVDWPPTDESEAEGDRSAAAGGLSTEAEAQAAFEALAARSDAAWPNTAARFLAMHEDLTIFLMLLEQAGLTDSLAAGDRPVTLFAPSDEAFARLDDARFQELIADRATLRDLLQRHIAAGSHSSARLAAGLEATAATAGAPGAKVPTTGIAADGAGGPDGELTAEEALASQGQVAGGGQASGVPALEATSFVRLPTRSGTDIEVGARPESVRSELIRLDSAAGRPASVQGGGAPAEPMTAEEGLYVGEARIVEADLEIEGLTLHVIDRVLLPADASPRR